MAELSADDVAAYTADRLDSGDEEVIRMLSAALQVARRRAGWHVSPVREETLILDGPDSRVLFLPTMKVVEITAVEEDGVVLDVADVSVSTGTEFMPRPVALRKSGAAWWTAEYGAIEIELSHGFTEAEAADWRQGILSMVDQMSLIPVTASTGRSEFGMSAQRVDDVQINWNPYATMAEELLFSMRSVIDGYKLPSLEYM
jgi:hypothetical protein